MDEEKFEWKEIEGEDRLRSLKLEYFTISTEFDYEKKIHRLKIRFNYESGIHVSWIPKIINELQFITLLIQQLNDNLKVKELQEKNKQAQTCSICKREFNTVNALNSHFYQAHTKNSGVKP